MTQHQQHNGHGRADESDDSGSETVGEDELSICDEEGPARVLQALNSLRKSRQHYDTVLVAGGAEVAAHRAVLAAASPLLLRLLGEQTNGKEIEHRIEGVEPEALRELVEYAYTGRARARDTNSARALYRAACKLRVEPVRAHLATALIRRLAPGDCLDTRALPALEPQHLEKLDKYIAEHFELVCESGALASLPLLRIELLREMGPGSRRVDAPTALADAALTWLRDRAPRHNLDELCSRVHLLYVDGGGALRDCSELPASGGDAPELTEYKREAAERIVSGAEAGAIGGECAVLAVRAATGGARALLSMGNGTEGRLASARVTWREVSAGGAQGTRDALAAGAATRARLAIGRCALGAAALNGRLFVCGGYDRARVLRTAEAYDPVRNAWTPEVEMRGARARFPAAALRGALYAVGGSDGQTELDSVTALADGAWVTRARLPQAVSHAAAVSAETEGALYLVGGWASGRSIKQVLRYSPDEDRWIEMPSLATGRSQCAAVLWAGALWAIGGCDTWHCLSSTETLGTGTEGWVSGPAIPTARRSMGGVSWRGRLVLAGGSDGTASLKRVDWLEPDGSKVWRTGPPLRRARAALGLAELGGTLYAVAGFDGKEFLSCVECLTEPDAEWTELCRLDEPPRPFIPRTESSEQDVEANK